MESRFNNFKKIFRLFSIGCLVFLIIIFITGLIVMLQYGEQPIENFPVYFPSEQFTLFEVFKDEDMFGIEPKLNNVYLILVGGVLNTVIGISVQRFTKK
jgi:hypothetical protein